MCSSGSWRAPLATSGLGTLLSSRSPLNLLSAPRILNNAQACRLRLRLRLKRGREQCGFDSHPPHSTRQAELCSLAHDSPTHRGGSPTGRGSPATPQNQTLTPGSNPCRGSRSNDRCQTSASKCRCNSGPPRSVGFVRVRTTRGGSEIASREVNRLNAGNWLTAGTRSLRRHRKTRKGIPPSPGRKATPAGAPFFHRHTHRKRHRPGARTRPGRLEFPLSNQRARLAATHSM